MCWCAVKKLLTPPVPDPKYIGSTCLIVGGSLNRESVNRIYSRGGRVECIFGDLCIVCLLVRSLPAFTQYHCCTDVTSLISMLMLISSMYWNVTWHVVYTRYGVIPLHMSSVQARGTIFCLGGGLESWGPHFQEALEIQLGGLRERCKLPRGVCGGTPAKV